MSQNHKPSLETRFWLSLDLSENIRIAQMAIMELRGASAVAMLLASIIIAVTCGALAYYFDVDPTVQYTEKMLWVLTPALSRFFRLSGDLTRDFASLAWLGWCFTMLPTAFEFFGSRVARANVPGVRYFLALVIAFDFMTDAANVNTFLDIFPGFFAAFGKMDWLALIFMRTILLPVASFYLEMLFFLFGALALILTGRCLQECAVYLFNRRNGVRRQNREYYYDAARQQPA